MNLFESLKYTVKIPLNTSVLYCENKKIIVIIGPLKRKCVKLKLKVSIVNEFIFINSDLFQNKTLYKNNKKIKSLQGTTKAILKNSLVETSSVIFKKLQFVGVGYRAFLVENYENQLISLKLGYSHSIYCRISSKLIVFCLKFTKLFISGNSYQSISQIMNLIRKYRKPEPYKGKGILYENEKIKLKRGKKT
jgi:large subunit ribosomal protein L6